jgi:phage terminase large subunit-like protein
VPCLDGTPILIEGGSDVLDVIISALDRTPALISDIGLERRKANGELYDKFEREGDLTKFDYVAPTDDRHQALPINIRYVVDLVEKVRDMGLLAQVGVDAAGIGAIVDALEDIGISQDGEQLEAVRQGIALLGAIKTVRTACAKKPRRLG